jgi:hypothetical protein
MSKTINAYRIKKIESLGKMTAMSQEEIVSAVRTVAQGLEALRSEHAGILHGLHEAPDPVANERAGLVQQSADMIELGLGEAQVRINFSFFLDGVSISSGEGARRKGWISSIAGSTDESWRGCGMGWGATRKAVTRVGMTTGRAPSKAICLIDDFLKVGRRSRFN